MKKLAKQSFGDPYECKQAWPADCYVQCGSSGIVFDSKTGGIEKTIEDLTDMFVEPTQENHDKVDKHLSKAYVTAFFEAFPSNPKTFIRGEGKTIEEAETKAWNQYQKYIACNEHEFERRGYTNGAGFCKNCGLFKSKAFPTVERCSVCNEDVYGQDNKGLYFCIKCYYDLPFEQVKSETGLFPIDSEEEWQKRIDFNKEYKKYFE